MDALLFVVGFLVINLVTHTGATCPIVNRKTCSDEKKKNHCQFDPENSWSVEICATPVLCKPGHYAFLDQDRDDVSCEPCSKDMYQPKEKWSNDFTQPNCDYPVTRCSGVGQYICEAATAIQNIKCACNNTAGYKPSREVGCDCFDQDSETSCKCQLDTASTFSVTSSSTSISTSTETETSTDVSTSPSPTTPPDNSLTPVYVVIPIVILVVGAGILCCWKRKFLRQKWKGLPCMTQTAGKEQQVKRPDENNGTVAAETEVLLKKPQATQPDGEDGDIQPRSRNSGESTDTDGERGMQSETVGHDKVDVKGMTDGKAENLNVTGINKTIINNPTYMYNIHLDGSQRSCSEGKAKALSSTVAEVHAELSDLQTDGKPDADADGDTQPRRTSNWANSNDSPHVSLDMDDIEEDGNPDEDRVVAPLAKPEHYP